MLYSHVNTLPVETMSLEETLVSALESTSKAQQRLEKSTPELDHAQSNSKAQGLPPIAIGPSQGQYLAILCQLIGAQNILELGTLGGYSTLWFANAVPGCKVTSLEVNPKHRDVAAENTKSCNNVDIVLGDALETLPQLQQRGEVFDFVFIDADWDAQQEYFDWAVKLSRKGGCIFVDNAVRQITESDPERGMKLVEWVKDDSRVNASLVPIVATHKKGRALTEAIDGFLIAYVK